MIKVNLQVAIKERIGLFLLFGSLLFIFLVKLPFNSLVICSNVNEGYYFVFGQKFLNERTLDFPGRTLFILFYALVEKISGFGTDSIIAIHWIQTVLGFLIAIVLFILVNYVFQSKLYSGLCVLFWTLMQYVPVGGWGQGTMEGELECSFALEAESFCVLFSLISIYCLLKGCLGKTKGQSSFLFSLLAGLCSALSTMFKANGAVIAIAVFCLVGYLFLFKREIFYSTITSFVYFFIGLVISLIVFSLMICVFKGDLNFFWQNYFTIGSYNQNFLKSPQALLLIIWNTMTRYYLCWSNFFLFLLALISFTWCLIRIFFIRSNTMSSVLFSPLLGIWGIGNFCALIAPGEYSSYYYVLIWPSMAIAFSIVLQDLFTLNRALNNNSFKIALVVFLSLFFMNRIFIVFPAYSLMLKNLKYLDIKYQPESFQEQVKVSFTSDYNSKRPNFLKIADLINSFLPDKNDTFYIFNLGEKHLSFTPIIYIYTKRLPSTTIVSDFLRYKKLTELYSDKLTYDLTHKSPKIIIVPDRLILNNWQVKLLNPFFQCLDVFLQKNYHFKTRIDYFCSGYLCHSLKEVESYNVYEHN